MAINIDEMYRFVQFVANKEQSGFIKPTEFNLAVDRAQMQLFMERYNNPAEYQPGRPIPRVAYQQTQKISDDLREFIRRVNITKTGTVFLYPNDYIHFSKANHTFLKTDTLVMDNEHCDEDAPMTTSTDDIKEWTRGIRPVDDSELNNLLDSVIVGPEMRYPILAFFEDGMEVYPSGINNIELTYLHRPDVPVWGWITNAEGRPIYNVGTSTNLEWAEQVFNEIAIRVLAFVGVNLREPELTQYSEQKRQTGI